MESKEATGLNSGRRVWLWTAVVVSAVVLVLAVAGIIGAWVGRSALIGTTDRVLDGVNRVAEVGRGAIVRLDERVGELRTSVVDVQTSVEQVAQNVEDRGLVLVLLPPEKEVKLVSTAEAVNDAVQSVRDVVVTAVDLYRAVDAIPFVSLPAPDPQKVETAQSDVQAVRDSVNEIATGIRDFREGAAGKIETVALAAGQVDTRLTTTQENLAAVDGELEALQARTVALKQQIRTWTAIAAILLTLILAWIAYALVSLIMRDWAALHGSPTEQAQTL